MRTALRATKSIQNEAGFTLMEVMLLGSILLVLIVAFATYQFQKAKETAAQDVGNTYRQLENNMKQKANQPQSVSKSEELDFSKMK